MRYLDFENAVAKSEAKASRINSLIDDEGEDLANEATKYNEKAKKQLNALYGKLTPWQRLQVARHEDRPRSIAFIRGLIKDFQRLRGDRTYGEDRAIITGMGLLNDRRVMVIAQERGHDTLSRIKHNFGMARPEGYRKVVRCIELAERFNLPIIALVDTPGADPGIESEERGQAQAIAESLRKLLKVPVPVIATIIGEGGSGGAIAIAAADKVMMLSNAVYTLISPEGCSSILWRDSSHIAAAADALKITFNDLLKLGVIDREIVEPLGGAHRFPEETIKRVGEAIYDEILKLEAYSSDKLLQSRYDRFMKMGDKGL